MTGDQLNGLMLLTQFWRRAMDEMNHTKARHLWHLVVAVLDSHAMTDALRQTAPYPTLLAELIDRVQYKHGWEFELKDLEGLTLIISVTGVDSYHPENGPHYTVLHFMIVPAAAYDERSWCRWFLEQILKVEQHEACEFFQIAGHRPYAPNHGPGRDPYTIMDQGTPEDAQTTFRGTRFELSK